MTFTLVTVRIQLAANDDGSFPAAVFSFRPTSSMSNDGVIVPEVAQRVTLEDGFASIELEANDDPDTVPQGTGYTVVQSVVGSTRRQFNITLNAATPEVDLANLLPAVVRPLYGYVSQGALGAPLGVATLDEHGRLAQTGSDSLIVMQEDGEGNYLPLDLQDNVTRVKHFYGATDPSTINTIIMGPHDRWFPE